MSKKLKFIASLVAMLFCLTGIAFGQETTGEIRGTVKDQAGAVVPNVTVTITGVSVGFKRTIQTDENGAYNARQVPPGNYSVSTAATSGFAEQVKDGVEVGIGTATTVDFAASSTVGANVTVVSEDSGIIVDTTETKAQDNISAREIEALPKGTGFSSLLRTTAAVRPEPLSGQFSINGATGPENSFIIDGQETQNYKNGLLNSNNDIPYQALQEIQVKTSGFEAEFGGATGGVINGVTKSGSNDFHGEFGINFSTEKLNAGPRPVLSNQLITTIPGTGQGLEFFGQGRDSGTNEYPTALLSGPVIKDKLWFFAIHSPRIVNVQRTTNFVQGFGATRAPATLSAALQALGAGTTQTAREKTTYNYSALRLDAAPFNSLRISSSITWNPIVDKGALLGGSYVLGAPGFTTLGGRDYQGSDLAQLQGGRQNSNNFRVEGIWIPTSKAVVDLRYTRGFLNQKLGSYGVASAPRVICQSVPAASVAVAGCVQGFQSNRNNDQVIRDVSIRSTIDANLSYSLEGLGRHEIKGGWQKSKIFNDVLTGGIETGGRTYLYYGRNTFSPNNVYVQWQIQPGNYPLPTLAPGVSVVGTGVTYQFGASGKATNIANTLYIQDKWQPTSRLTLNLGLRTEQEQIPAFNNNAIDLKFKWADKLAPRLGAAYALTADGKTKISAFYGRFFDRLKFSLPQGSFGGNFYHVSYFYITSDKPYSYYTVANLKGGYAFPPGGQCPISLTTPNGYVCDQDYRIASNTPGANALQNGAVDPNVKPYRQSEYTFEFQREVMRATVFTARYLHRNLDQAIEDAGIPTAAGEAYVIGNPGQGLAADVYKQLGYNKAAKPVRKYNALQLEMDTRFVKNFNLNLNYTLSRLRGNYSGLAGPDEAAAPTLGRADLNSRNDPNVLRDFDEPWVGFTASGQEAIGLLPLDRTHVFKASGTYSFDWMRSSTNSTDLSFFTTAQSGTPLTTFVNVFGIPIPETQRGDLGRTEMFTQTDLNLSHRVKFGNDNQYALAFDFNVINALNQNHVLALSTNKSSGYFALAEGDVVASESTVEATNILTSRGVLAQYNAAEAAFGAANGGLGFARNLSYLQPIAFQERRQVRFGFRFIF
jgi:hypothetical protein